MGHWLTAHGGWLLAAAAFSQLATLIWVWRRRDSAAATGLAGMLLATFVWNAANSLELFSTTMGGRELWGAVKYLGIVLLPPAWWTFLLQYVGRGRRLPAWALAALSVVPVGLTVILAVPSLRHLLHTYHGPVADCGPLFWPFVAYIGTTLIGGLIAFAVILWRTSPLYRRQCLVLGWYAVLPLSAIIVFNTGIFPSRTLDPTPLAFAVGTYTMAWGVFRYRLLQLRPVARGQVVDTLPDAVVVLDLYGRVIDVNRSGERLLGHGAPTVIGRPLRDLIDVNSDAPTLEVGERSFDLRVKALTNRFDRLLGQVLVGRDVTDEQRAERGRQEAEARFRAAFDSAVIGMALVAPAADGQPVVLEVNAALCQLTGHGSTALVGRPLWDLISTAPAAPAASTPPAAPTGPAAPAEEERTAAGALRRAGERAEMIGRLISGEDPVWTRELELRRADGHVVWVLLGIARVSGVTPPHLIVQMEDITERKLAEQRLTQQALHDPLTGVANRALFVDRLDQALAAAARDPHEVAVLHIDLNGFKTVNDAFGHSAGDRLLQKVADRVTELLRPQDTVARLGGDEFAVVLPELAEPQDASAIAERLAARLAEPYVLDVGTVSTPASIGIAVAGPGDDPDSLLRDADAAMYVAKRRARSGVERFTPRLRAHLRERRQLASELRLALRDGSLEVRFQPIVELPSRRVVSAEALLRWPHPRRGELQPVQFLPIADSAGLTVDLGEWVLRQALERVVRRECADGLRDLTVAVNIAPRQLSLPDFPAMVTETLHSVGAKPTSLCLEVTENGLLDSPELAAEALDKLRTLGVLVALDDFGTGSSSLSHIRTLPIDMIKIDKSFVQNLVTEAADLSIVRSIIDLGHALGHVTVAEGVETDEQLDLLVDLGCDRAQGFLLARPAREL